LRLRDERIGLAESQLQKITAEYNKLREDLLPVFKLAKETQPLPYPNSINSAGYPYGGSDTISPPAQTPSSVASAGGLSRKFSTKKLFYDTAKNSSPTFAQSSYERSLMERSLDPANAAMEAVLSNRTLNTRNGGSEPAISPGFPSPSQPSPTSPPIFNSSTLGPGSYERQTPRVGTFNEGYGAPSNRDSRKPAPGRSNTPAPDSGGGASVEIFKSFRVSMEDPCYKVLPAALKKYNINAPWEQYALYIVYGDQERCLGMQEKPLILFKQLDKEGKKPMFMLRKLTSNADGMAGDIPGSAGLDPHRPYQNTGYEPPGGII
jgi:hypothetical protein